MYLFKITSAIYENIEKTEVNLVKIENQLISKIQKNISDLFSILDKNDLEQKQISLRIWLLKSTVVFTLLNFDDPVLAISKQLGEIQSLALRFPSIQSTVNQLETNIASLLKAPNNPKREWLEKSIKEAEKDKIAVFTNLSSGRSPGWVFDLESTFLNDRLGELSYVRTTKDFKNNIFDRVVLPCGCSNTPYHILVNIIYSGVTSRFDVLLYQEERFNIPKRLLLPIDKKNQGKFQGSLFEKNVVEVQNSKIEDSIDGWINSSFWSEIHEGERNFSTNLIPAHYVLFKNGTGTFLPKDGRALTLIESSDQNFTPDHLQSKNVENLVAGDLVVIRSGESGFLLDDASNLILHKSGVGDLLEDATDWKSALDALTLIYDWSQISQALKSKNVNVTPTTIQRWAGAEGLGPGTEFDFSALIHLLIDENKITLNCDAENYISDKWKKLRELRGVRQKAGNLIRSELFDALSEKMTNSSKPLKDKTVIQMNSNSDVELLIMRVFTVDQTPSYIHTAQIGRLDDLRNNKWLG